VIRISKENHTYYYDKENKPVSNASIGDKVIFETFDCFRDQLKKDEDLADFIDMSHINPNTGPLFIKGAETGDILVIKILDIKVEDHGVLTLIPGEGKLRHYVKSPITKIVKMENGQAFFSEDIVIKNKPHVGTIGTTPFGRIPTGLIGIHGGNMDCPEAEAGAKIYFPIFGLECGAEVTIEIVEVIKDKFIPAPIIESKDYWYIVSNAPSLKEAVRIGAKRMADFVSDRLEISLEDATLLVSIVGNVRIAQDAEADYDVSVYVQFPKYVDKRGRLDKFYYDKKY